MDRRWAMAVGALASGCLLRPTSDHANTIFVTSQTLLVDDGFIAADKLCNDLARQAGLDGSYVAWLSAMGSNAVDRLGAARGWVRPDGLPFVDTVADLVAGAIRYPPRIDETGSDLGPDAMVATGTQNDGTDFDGNDCFDLHGSTTTSIGYGLAGAGAPDWTYGGSAQVTTCGTPLHLYCFGTDDEKAVAAPAPATRGPVVFVSHETFTATGSGLMPIDAQCATDAIDLGLTQTFVSVLATNQASALSRLGTPTAPWVRLDGVATTMDFTTFTAPISVDSTKAYVASPVYTGAPNGSALGTDDCGSWQDSQDSAVGVVGDSALGDAGAFDASQSACSTPLPVYCASVQ